MLNILFLVGNLASTVYNDDWRTINIVEQLETMIYWIMFSTNNNWRLFLCLNIGNLIFK